MDTELWKRLDIGPAGLDRLQRFAGLVEKWTRSINLIAKSTLPDLWARHIEDSARLMSLVPQPPRLWADLGAGGGFPGLVVAVILSEKAAETKVVLVESDQRKATFLREAARQLSLPTIVQTERAEILPPLAADLLSARALAPLDGLCALAERHLAPGGRALFPKGASHAAECSVAAANWRFDLEAHEDPGHKGSAILELRNLTRAGA